MNNIRACIHDNEYYSNRCHKDFRIVDSKPQVYSLEELKDNIKYLVDLLRHECIGINELELDCEQPSDNAWNYSYYCVKFIDFTGYYHDTDGNKNIDDYIDYGYIAILNK